MTPEGRVKKRIDDLLRLYEETGVVLWAFKPVQMGYGKTALDYLVCVKGKFLGIEAKAEGEWLTIGQRKTTRDIVAAGGAVFAVSRNEGLEALARWLGRQ